MRSIFVVACALSTALLSATAATPTFKDPLSTPSMPSALASVSTLTGVAAAGKRLVGVGPRGHLLISDDLGQSWSQKVLPLSSDLVAVSFPTPSQGWVTGHDGVVLKTDDGGQTWTVSLDGYKAAAIMVKYYGDLAKSGDAEAIQLSKEAERIGAEGADKPFLDVYFESPKVGYVVGAFNMIFKTVDGGVTWEPWYHRTDNPNRLHLHALAAAGDTLFLVGEQGLILRLDRERQRFVAVQSPYQGSFFGAAAKPGVVVAYGLRGHAFRSRDGGMSWQKLDTGINNGITGGTFLADGRLVLVSQGGEVLQSADDGATFVRTTVDRPMPWYGVSAAPANGYVALVGARGVRVSALK